MIPNWVDTKELVPQPRRTPWSGEQGLDRSFVVMHSGNVGHAQDLDTLVRAATFLRDLDGLEIVVIGFGARHAELTELAERLEVDGTVRFLGYQPPLAPLALARGRRPALRRPRARPLRVRRAEPRLRDPLGRPAGARLRGRGQRDRAPRRGGGLRPGRPPGHPGSSRA